MTLLACEMTIIVQQFDHSLALPFFGIENLPFPALWPTAEFSKYAGILSATLSQNHVLALEIAQLEFHHLH